MMRQSSASCPSLPLAGTGSTSARLLREPLLHFFLLGGLLWLIYAHFQVHAQISRIVISKAFVAHLAARYQQQYGAVPTAAQLDALIGTATQEEMSYREALKLGLDKDDEIVRRRLIQKYEFLRQDSAASPDPAPEQLADFYRRHADHYVLPERLTFTHVYFSPDHRGEAGARAAAAALADSLNDRGLSRAPDEGDRFPGPADVVDITPEQLARVFGRDDFLANLEVCPGGRWSTPIRSGYGWHTVFVSAHVPGRPATLDEARDRVSEDYLDEARRRRAGEAMRALRRDFEIVRE